MNSPGRIMLLLLLLVAIAGCSAVCSKDYCLPGLQCWPSAVSIAGLQDSITGSVLQPFNPGYNDAIKMDNLRLAKSPGIVVMAENNNDVSLAIRFANKHNILITVMTSGHDRTGKSSVDGSLQINLSRMQGSIVQLDNDRNPAGVISVQAGATWSQVYQQVDSVDRVVVGANSPFETVGGFTENGGYGPLSRSLGLVTDNLLMFEMVNANGNLVIATPEMTSEQFSNGSTNEIPTSDIFWAVRGGGSNTFGVVTSFVFKLHIPPSSMFSLLCAYAFIGSEGSEVGNRVLSTYLNYLPTLPSEWSGSLLTTSADPAFLAGTSTVLFATLFHYGPWNEPSRSAMDPITTSLRDAEFSCEYTNFTSFWEWKKNYTNDIYYRSYQTNVFLQYDSLRPEVVDVIMNASSDFLSPLSTAEIYCFVGLLGGAVKSFPVDSSPTSVGYRTALASVTCHGSWNNASHDDVNSRAIQELGKKLRQYSQGVYLNDQDHNISDWKEEYWGRHYGRLLTSKTYWDPNNIFFCKRCVGSDKLGFQGCNITQSGPSPTEEGKSNDTTYSQRLDLEDPKFCSRYCSPGHTCWPSRAELSGLDGSLTGYILTPNMPDYHKSVVMKDTLYTRYPGVIVFPLSTQDVQKAMAFAKRFNIRLTVLSSGHDYNGKSTADGSLQINLSKMNRLRINMNDERSSTGESIYAETGNVWGRVYKEVDKYNRVVVGGSALTVALGGYTTGGGHSIFSRALGLAVDNVVEFQIVLADGTIANATANGTVFVSLDGSVGQSPSTDIFWAVLGGGGSTFGVVTSFTYQLHTPPPQLVSWTCSYPVNVGELIIGQNVTNLFWSILPKLSYKWGGYYLIRALSPSEYNGTVGYISFAFLHYGGWSEPSVQDIQPIQDFMKEYQYGCTFANHSSYMEYKGNTTDAIYFRNYIFNTLLQKDTLTDQLTTTLLEGFITPSEASYGCTGVLLGGKVSEVAVRSTSVGKHLRTSLNSVSCGLAWIDPRADLVNIAAGKALGEKLHKQGRGVYYNEPDIHLPTWKADFWGENYARLLTIKQQWDKDNFFYCHHCVGSDLVETFSCNKTDNIRASKPIINTDACSAYENPIFGGLPITQPLQHGIGFCSRYCLPGNPCWPLEVELTGLGDSISGSVLTPNGADFGQMPGFDTIRNPPLIVVKPSSVTDVQKALVFGRERNLKITPVSSDVPDITAASTSFHIDLSNMTDVRVNLNDVTSPTGASVSVSSGTSWQQVYEEVDKVKKIVVGAASSTVLVDDFVGAGGYGPLSRKFGLAVDNVLSFSIILADSRIAEAFSNGVVYLHPNGSVEQSTSSDLFWAVRGGGIDTFGIVTDITFVLHDAPQGFVHYLGIWRSNQGPDPSVGVEMLETFHRLLPLLPVSWGGQLVTLAQTPQDGLNGTIAVSLLYFGNFGPAADGDIKRLEAIAPANQLVSQNSNYTTYLDYHKNSNNGERNSSFEYSFNTFLQYDSNPKDVAEFIVNVTLDYGTCVEAILGGKVSEASANKAAINPAFRTAYASLECSFRWGDAANSDAVRKLSQAYADIIRELGKGTYMDGIDPDLTDWQESLWGQHYERLMEIKVQEDPGFLLNCDNCVGSNLVQDFYNESYGIPEATTSAYTRNYTKPTISLVDFVENNEFITRYCVPGLPCWPTDAELISLETSLDGSILQPFDKGYTQHSQLKNSLWNKSPGLIIFPLSVSDIQRAVLFARDHNLRVTVISSGHSLNGQSTADGSMQINLSKMKTIILDPIDSRSPTVESVTAEAGVTWGDIYRAVNRWSRRVVVGPSCLSVSVGGYTMGGGFSPLSPSHGFATDHVIAMQMVTADGRIANLTASGTALTDVKGNVSISTDTDLFQALRGGGGGTFGIVSSLTYMVHYAPPQLVQLNCMFEPSGNNVESLKEILNYFLVALANLPEEWGGKFVVSTSPGPLGEDVIFAGIYLLHFGPFDSPTRRAADPLLEFRTEWQTSCRYTLMNTFWDYIQSVSDLPFDRAYISNGLVDLDQLTPSLIDALVNELLRGTGTRNAKTCFYDLLGAEEKLALSSPDSIHPRLRKAVFSLTCSVIWAENTDDVINMAAGVRLQEVLLNNTAGIYLNYAPYHLQNWRSDLWGNKYNALLATKKKWDPENFFYCRHCVGSEIVVNYREQTRSQSRPTGSQTADVTEATGSTHSVHSQYFSCLLTLLVGCVLFVLVL